MKEYRYERLSYDGWIEKRLAGLGETIDRCAAEGWSYAGNVISVFLSGAVNEVTLIFERDTEG